MQLYGRRIFPNAFVKTAKPKQTHKWRNSDRFSARRGWGNTLRNTKSQDTMLNEQLRNEITIIIFNTLPRRLGTGPDYLSQLSHANEAMNIFVCSNARTHKPNNDK